MDSILLIPLLFPIEPGFADLRDGSFIRVIRPSDGEHRGILHVTYQPETGLFGAVIRFGPRSLTGGTPPSTSDRQGFAATGHSGVPIHRLTLEELRAIGRTGDPETPLILATWSH